MAVLGLGAALTLSLSVGSASAARGLITGFSDGGPYTSSDPNVRASAFDRTAEVNAGLVRLNLRWALVAPSRPVDPNDPGSLGYDFTTYDRAIRDARARGLQVMATLLGAPGWAEGPGRPASADPGTWKPNPTDLGAFARAVAARYSGNFAGLPAIQAIQIWNEPNLPVALTPQFEGSTPFASGHYRQMLNASYAGIKAVNPGMLVVTGGTAPYGGPTPKGPRIRPVAFDRDLLCVTAVRSKKGKPPRFVRTAGCAAPANFDVLGHNTINTTGPPTQGAVNPDDASSPDIDRLARVLRGAERAGTTSPGTHAIWATEMWWDSNPPDSAGSPLARQARWIELAMYLAWRDGASAVVNLLLEDTTASSHNVLDGSASGIYFANGKPKPSAVAFRFPFVTHRLNRGRVRAWGKAPKGGMLRIQRRAHRHWATVRKLRVSQGSVFAVKLRLRGKQHLRARVPGETSLVWNQR